MKAITSLYFNEKYLNKPVSEGRIANFRTKVIRSLESYSDRIKRHAENNGFVVNSGEANLDGVNLSLTAGTVNISINIYDEDDVELTVPAHVAGVFGLAEHAKTDLRGAKRFIRLASRRISEAK